MRYVNYSGPGGPDVLEIKEGPQPVPREDEVLIRVEAAGVNRPDLAQRQGKYPAPADASPVLGLEVAGTVVKGAGPWREGDRVCALVHGGGYAEYCVASASHCLPIPAGISFEAAAGFCETYFTVWANVFQIGRLAAGESFLVHGGSSGIGTTAVQLAKAFGARVFATAGSAEKCQACLDLGADAAINYREQDFVAEVAKLTSGAGVNLILDMVAGLYTPRNLECLARDGRIVQIAVQQGAEVTLNMAKVMQKRAWITGSTLRPRTVAEKAAIAAGLREKVLPLWEQGIVRVVIDKVFPFEQVVEAHRHLEAGQHVGKVILKF